jgi:hypothetical protein
MRRVRLLVIAGMLATAALTSSAGPAFAGEWVAFPATWAWCEYDAYGVYWCWLENDQMWSRVNPAWQSAPLGG